MTERGISSTFAAGLLVTLLFGSAGSAAPVKGLAFVKALRASDTEGLGGLDVEGAEGIGGAQWAALSPDGNHLYVVGQEDALAVFARDSATGLLTSVEVERNGVGGVDGIDSGSGLVVSPDGAHVYVSGRDDDAVAVFSRNATTGEVTFVEVQRDGVGGVDGLAGVESVVISPDGAHIYATGRDDDSVAVFSRNGTTGALTFVEVQTDGVGGVEGIAGPFSVAVAPNGSHVYVAGGADDAVAVFSRNGTTGALTFVEVQQDGVAGVDGLAEATSVAVSPDDAHVYVAGNDDNAIAAFDRNPVTGALSFATSYSFGSAYKVVVSADGTLLYGVNVGGGLALFSRDGASGALTFLEQQVNGQRGLLFLSVATSVAVSADNRHAYVTAIFIGSVTIFQGVQVRCEATPLPGCRQPTEPGRAVLVLQRNVNPAKDRARWKWPVGALTTLTDLGDPLTTTDYVLCVYDASGGTQPVLLAVAPSDGLCAGEDPCWKVPLMPGFRYLDRFRAPDGLRRVVLRPGVAGEALLKVQATGENIGWTPTLPLTPPVTVQMVNSAGECWEATYSTPSVNTALEFRAKGD
jgi:6-phosphogluconolactonase (cycloisomerase 2 family)